MKYQTRLFAASSPDATRPTSWRRGAGLILLCALALALVPASDGVAQDAFPSGATQIFYDDMESYTNMSQTITWTSVYPYWQWIHGYSGLSDSRFYVEDPAPSNVVNGVWGVKHLGNLNGMIADSSLMVIRDSIPPSDPVDGAQNTNAVAYNPADWTNIRFEMDVQITQLMVPGMVWAMTAEYDTAYPPENRGPADGYIFYLESTNSNGFTSGYNCRNTVYPGSEVKWHLARIQGFDRSSLISGQKDWVHLASDYVTPWLPGTETVATVEDGTLAEKYLWCLSTNGDTNAANAYRFRLEVFCGNIRLKYLIVDGDTGTHPDDTLYKGCNAETAAPCVRPPTSTIAGARCSRGRFPASTKAPSWARGWSASTGAASGRWVRRTSTSSTTTSRCRPLAAVAARSRPMARGLACGANRRRSLQVPLRGRPLRLLGGSQHASDSRPGQDRYCHRGSSDSPRPLLTTTHCTKPCTTGPTPTATAGTSSRTCRRQR